MPMTTHVTGLASSAAVKLHTEDMSGVSAPRASAKPPLSILNALTVFVTTRPTPEIRAISVPPTGGGCGGCGGGCASGGCAGCSGCGGGAEREPYVETRTFTDIVTLTSENFQTEVLDDPGLILIDFWAEWCQPCRMLAPAFEELNREEPQVKFCRVNVDEQGELAQMFGIESIPTLAVVQDRHTLTGSVGLRSKEEIKAMLDGCK